MPAKAMTGKLFALCAITFALLTSTARAADEAEMVQRGAYLARAAGCQECHSAKDSPAYAGGHTFKTPFGIFYSPNITPDRETGIGGWSEEDFLAALHDGRRPDGGYYYPVFPYPSYTQMTKEDALAIRAYLFSLPPTQRENRPHELNFPFSIRLSLLPWRWLFFENQRFSPDPAVSEEINRGAYLANALAHCGECHTPRNALGALQTDRHLAGSNEGPNGELVPNITPDEATGIADWSEGDLVELMRSGLKPNFDDVQGSMMAAIDGGLKHLTEDDLLALARYLKSIPAIHNKVVSKKE